MTVSLIVGFKLNEGTTTFRQISDNQTFKDLTNGIEMIDALALSYNAIAEVVQNSQS